MKLWRLTMIALVLVQYATATDAATCSKPTLSGSYAFSAWGRGTTDPTRPAKWANIYIAIAGVMTFTPTPGNVDGTVTRMFTLSVGGGIGSASVDDVGSKGTWIEDGSTCSGTVTFPNTPLGVETYEVFFSRDGNTIFFINSTSGVVLSGQMERQDPP
jgi:hypothetical protein